MRRVSHFFLFRCPSLRTSSLETHTSGCCMEMMTQFGSWMGSSSFLKTLILICLTSYQVSALSFFFGRDTLIASLKHKCYTPDRSPLCMLLVSIAPIQYCELSRCIPSSTQLLHRAHPAVSFSLEHHHNIQATPGLLNLTGQPNSSHARQGLNTSILSKNCDRCLSPMLRSCRSFVVVVCTWEGEPSPPSSPPLPSLQLPGRLPRQVQSTFQVLHHLLSASLLL